MTHPNQKIYTMTHRKNHPGQYNEYMRAYMKRQSIWNKIKMEFLRILLE